MSQFTLKNIQALKPDQIKALLKNKFEKSPTYITIPASENCLVSDIAFNTKDFFLSHLIKVNLAIHG